MLQFVKCLGEGFAAVGIKELFGLIPGGKYLYEVALYAIKRYREQTA